MRVKRVRFPSRSPISTPGPFWDVARVQRHSGSAKAVNSVWESLVNPVALEATDRWFESNYADQFIAGLL